MTRSVAAVGTEIPGFSDLYIEYKSGKSLHDYDIVLFDMSFPYYPSEGFSGGSSALTEIASVQIQKDMAHWSDEIRNAIADGKTVFVLLSAEQEIIRTGHKEYKGKTTIHGTSYVQSQSSLPFNVTLVNSKGTRVKVMDARFRQLYELLQDYIEYQVYIPGQGPGKQIFATISGTNTLGSVLKLKDKAGHVVLLPYYKFDSLTTTQSGKTVWSKKGMGVGSRFMNQLIEIDKSLRREASQTPTPEWVSGMPVPQKSASMADKIEKIDEAIEKKLAEKERTLKAKQEVDSIQGLLYENGSSLENAIEVALKLLGYEVSKFRQDALEIDHVIISPEGERYIGEAEGKDTSAVDISKFRQLESNINEDFEREEVTEPARGILFGNGYRLLEPSTRSSEFTDKCLLNAKRLRTPLVRTRDLYPLAVYLIDKNDEAFKRKCREAIDKNEGDIVEFPEIPKVDS